MIYRKRWRRHNFKETSYSCFSNGKGRLYEQY